MTTTTGLRVAMERSDRAPARRGIGPAWLRAAIAVAALAGLAACGGHVSEGKDCPPAQRARTVSGFCVPRYVTLKRGEVYGRQGPGKDYPALWIYHVRGLPVQIVAETEDWRRICDPDGGATWVHRSMVDGRRAILAIGPGPVTLRRRPSDAAPASGYLNARALASLKDCRGDWCKVTAEGVTGWMPAARAWGLARAPQCR